MSSLDSSSPATQQTSARSEVVLSATNLKVRYRNGALGVVDASFSVGRGEVVALFGSNGAGKTTCVRAASGFLRTEGARIIGGHVLLHGKDVTNAEPHRIHADGVAVVPERRKVFASLSVADNLAALGQLPPRSRRAAVYEHVYELFPILAERRAQIAGRLSGGQQQMLAIARCLICEPEVLIVDELTLGLHHSLHQPLFSTIRSIAGSGTSVVVVDESAGLALDVADYCYLLAGGQTGTEGVAEDFRTRNLLAAGYVEAADGA